MATKHFQSSTGYGVTLWLPNASGSSNEVRVPADGSLETDDKELIAALKASAEVQEVKPERASSDDEGDSKPSGKGGGR